MPTNGVEKDPDFDPYNDPEELQAITSALSSFHLYRRAAHQNLTHRRRASFFALTRTHQHLLQQSPINYLSTLDSIDSAIEDNAVLSEAIFRAAVEAFGIDLETTGGGFKKWERSASNSDLDKVRSTLKQFSRDWSIQGAREREVCYGGVMNELEARFGNVEDKSKIRVLIPGAGLGRLAFDIAVAGYTSQGNEFSYHQLMASNYILNHTTSAHQHSIHPFISTFSNHPTRTSHLRAQTVPDLHPATHLSTGGADHFSMTAGDFTHCYRASAEFDVCATVFFIDTAPNIITYLDTIHNLLAPDGVWINFGPLLWHFEDSPLPEKGKEGKGGSPEGGHVELCLDEVLELVRVCGFRIERVEKGLRTSYAGDGESMLRHEFEGAFWVAVKV